MREPEHTSILIVAHERTCQHCITTAPQIKGQKGKMSKMHAVTYHTITV
jgi:hypothetical protein